MPATRYKIWTGGWGAPVGIGATAPNFVGIAGVAKRADATHPRVLANEIICNSLAHVLLLPCPPGATLDREGTPYFFSLDFNLAGEALPPADPATIVENHPRLAWGILLFDLFVMNHDRHERNIAHDLTTNRVQIFDHSHAFLHGSKDVGDILSSQDGNICIGDHCLAPEIFEEDGLELWCDKISRIPDYFLEELIASVVDFGLPLTKKDDCIDFLKKRRGEVKAIVDNNRDKFPKLPQVLA